MTRGRSPELRELLSRLERIDVRNELELRELRDRVTDLERNHRVAPTIPGPSRWHGWHVPFLLVMALVIGVGMGVAVSWAVTGRLP